MEVRCDAKKDMESSNSFPKQKISEILLAFNTFISFVLLLMVIAWKIFSDDVWRGIDWIVTLLAAETLLVFSCAILLYVIKIKGWLLEARHTFSTISVFCFVMATVVMMTSAVFVTFNVIIAHTCTKCFQLIACTCLGFVEAVGLYVQGFYHFSELLEERTSKLIEA